MKFDNEHGKPKILMRLFVRFLPYFLISDHCDAIEFAPQTKGPRTVNKLS